MGRIIFVTGGARSGKSSFAEGFLKNEDKVAYVATGIAFDDEMKERVAVHRERRNRNWETIEAYRCLDEKLGDRDINAVIVDCITIMVSNIMLLGREDADWDNVQGTVVGCIEKDATAEIGKLLIFARNFGGLTIIVSNELGMGIVPPTPLGRYYRDIAGRINQMIAREADEVYFMVSGIAVKIKG